MSDADLEAKFRGLATGVLAAQQIDEVIDLCWKVAELDDGRHAHARFGTASVSVYSTNGFGSMKKTVYYFHALSSPWAYLGGPQFHALIKKHDLNVVLRPTRIVTENGGIPLRTRPDPRQHYHEVELDRWRKKLDMPLVLRPKALPHQQ